MRYTRIIPPLLECCWYCYSGIRYTEVQHLVVLGLSVRTQSERELCRRWRGVGCGIALVECIPTFHDACKAGFFATAHDAACTLNIYVIFYTQAIRVCSGVVSAPVRGLPVPHLTVSIQQQSLSVIPAVLAIKECWAPSAQLQQYSITAVLLHPTSF